MLKKTITYTDYNDVTHTEDFYFNLNKAEVTELQLFISGKDDIINLFDIAKDNSDNLTKTEADAFRQKSAEIVDLYKRIILKAYGTKSVDGKRFIKSDEAAIEFSQTEAFSELFMELLQNRDGLQAFLKGVMPKDTELTVAVK